MRLERQPRDHAQTAPTATLETPEQFGVGTGIGDPYGAIGGDYFSFEEPGRGEAVAFREAAKAATVNEPGHTDRRAPTALHIAAAARRDRVVGVEPQRTGLDRDGRVRGVQARAALAHEGLVRGDAVHRPRPDEQG